MTTMSDLRSANAELEHYGVLGMKWGVRKDRAEGYSDTQYKQDKAIYGTRGANRINKRIRTQGYGVKGARSAEKTKHDAAVTRSKTTKQVGKVVGALGGSAAATVGNEAIARYGAIALYKVTNNLTLSSTFGNLIRSSEGKAAIAIGAAKVGSIIGGSLGEKAALVPEGYRR